MTEKRPDQELRQSARDAFESIARCPPLSPNRVAVYLPSYYTIMLDTTVKTQGLWKSFSPFFKPREAV